MKRATSLTLSTLPLLLALSACGGRSDDAGNLSNASNAAAQASAQEMHNIMSAEEKASGDKQAAGGNMEDHHAAMGSMGNMATSAAGNGSGMSGMGQAAGASMTNMSNGQAPAKDQPMAMKDE